MLTNTILRVHLQCCLVHLVEDLFEYMLSVVLLGREKVLL